MVVGLEKHVLNGAASSPIDETVIMISYVEADIKKINAMHCTMHRIPDNKLSS